MVTLAAHPALQGQRRGKERRTAMPRKLINALDALTVKNAKPGRHSDGGGLQLLIKESGAKSWVYRFTVNGQSRDVGLGSADKGGLSLAKAREARDAIRVMVRAGIDPIAERERKAAEAKAAAEAARIAAVTFKSVAETYLKANKDSWRNNKHRQQWHNTLATYVFPVIGEMSVQDVSTEHVLKILEPIWKAKPETAARIRGRIETVLDAAKARGYRSGENPARWRGHIAQILPPRTKLSRGHYKAMSYDQVPAFMADLRKREAMAALALEFTILTAARTGEVIGASWSEVDLDKGIWTIPASRMKAGREHRVPLPARAVEILENTKKLGKESLFPAARGGKHSGMAMSMLLRRMKQDVTVHGFRSAFRDWAAECTGYSHEVAEMALAHTISNQVERAYRRGDLFEKRRQMMADWATYCSNSSPGTDEEPQTAANTEELHELASV